MQMHSNALHVPCSSSFFSHFLPYSGNALITDSNATNAIAFAGNALKKHGTNPLQYPLHPCSLYTALAASLHRGNLRPGPSGSVMMRCLMTSLG